MRAPAIITALSAFFLLAATTPEQRLFDARKAAQESNARVKALEKATARALTEAEDLAVRNALLAARVQHSETTLEKVAAGTAILDRQVTRQRARLAKEQERVVSLLAALETLSRRPAVLALVQPGSLQETGRVAQILDNVIPLVRSRTASLRHEMIAFRTLRERARNAHITLAAARQNVVDMRLRLASAEQDRRKQADTLATRSLLESDRALALSVRARDLEDLIHRLNADEKLRIQLAALPGPVLRPANIPDHALPPERKRTATPPAVTNQGVDKGAALRPTFAFMMPAAGTLVEGFGEISPAGIRSRGISLRTAAGTQVVAPAAGRIAFAGPFREFGNIVIIEHGDDITSLIAGLARLQTRTGAKVVPGAIIGTMAADANRLTLEIRNKGEVVDPLSLIGAD